MKKRIVVCLFAILLIAGVATSGFAQTELINIQKGVAAFSGDIANALPFNSALGLNWSDAYIGQFPHFGIGLSAGATTMEISAIKTLAGYFATDISLDMSKMPLPAYTVEGRIGGFVLPFDIGLKFGVLPGLSLFDLNLNYLMVGGDIRYALLDGVSNKALPNLSVGVGVNYLKGGVGGSVGGDQSITYSGNTISFTEPNVNLSWNTVSLDLKAQISKTFAFLTPYFGAAGSYAWSGAGYSVDSDIRVNGHTVTQEDIDNINNFLSSNGLDPVDVKVDGISSIIKDAAFNARLYGGFSVNIMAFRLDITGLFNILDQNFGADIGLRFQF